MCAQDPDADTPATPLRRRFATPVRARTQEEVRSFTETAVDKLKASAVTLFLQEQRTTHRLRWILRLTCVLALAGGIVAVVVAVLAVLPQWQLSAHDCLSPALHARLRLSTVSVEAVEPWSHSTPLHFACDAGARHAVEALLRNNATVLSPTNVWHDAPAHLCAVILPSTLPALLAAATKELERVRAASGLVDASLCGSRAPSPNAVNSLVHSALTGWLRAVVSACDAGTTKHVLSSDALTSAAADWCGASADTAATLDWPTLQSSLSALLHTCSDAAHACSLTVPFRYSLTSSSLSARGPSTADSAVATPSSMLLTTAVAASQCLPNNHGAMSALLLTLRQLQALPAGACTGGDRGDVLGWAAVAYVPSVDKQGAPLLPTLLSLATVDDNGAAGTTSKHNASAAHAVLSVVKDLPVASLAANGLSCCDSATASLQPRCGELRFPDALLFHCICSRCVPFVSLPLCRQRVSS